MDNIFEIIDKTGRIICLLKERWKHITKKHPKVNNTNELYETLLTPLFIKQDELDEFLHYYYRFDKLKKEYLMVAVKYLNGKGFILTSFYTKRIRK